MNIQLPPNTRTSDPESSHRAGEAITDSGVRLTQCERVLQAVRLQGGFTAKELALVHEWEHHMVSRRLADLAHKGLVIKVIGKNGKPHLRKCIVGGRASCTWVLM